MNINNKVFHLNSQFKKELPTADEAIDNIFITGYASVNSVDRAGDVVLSSAWAQGMENYLKNPIILAYHDHDDPVGRMVEHKVDAKGLWIKARISAAAEVFNLVKDGVLTAFSVSFKVKDAEYNPATELFVVKELELIEISVVSVPCNQDTLFSLSKSFETDEEYKSFKLQYTQPTGVAKGLTPAASVEGNKTKEIVMDPKDIQALLESTAERAATLATKALLDKQAAEKEALDKAAAEEALMQKRIAEAVAKVTPSTSGAERLLADIEKKLSDQVESSRSALEGLENSIREKAAELAKIQSSKMTFTEGKAGEATTYAEREKAVLLSKITGKSIEDTKFGKQLLEKAGTSTQTTLSPHVPSGIWELEVSTNMESEIRRKLIVVPNIRSIEMKTNVMTIPVNPEAGLANWVTNAQFGAAPATLGAAGASAGNTATHALKEITLNAYKLATNEYLNYEEDEDSLIALLPIVRDAMVRRVARSMDRAYLYGAGTGADPVKGLATWGTATALAAGVTGAASGAVTVAALRAMRKDLGAWGLDPSAIIYVVSTDIYYQLLEDPVFQTMNQVGDKATLLTGQIGSIGNSPVLVSGEFATKANGVTGAICFAPGNFLAGNQRGLRVETDTLIETQRRVLVASLRTGMTQVTTNLGNGVSKLVHTA